MKILRETVIACLLLPTALLAEPVVKFLGASTTEMKNPHDLKLSADGRHLYVSDVGSDRVLIIDPETLEPLGAFGSDHQAGTHDVDVDAEGRLYVADTHNNRVTIYEMDGLSATLSGELSDKIRGAEGVLAHPNGQIYVAGAWSDNVVAYRDGEVVGELTGLASPHDLEVTPEGDIWLADAGNNRLMLLDPELQVKEVLEGEPYNFDGVRYLDVLADGTIIAADKNSHSIKLIAPDRTLLSVIGGERGKGPELFTTPEGVETRAGSEGLTVWFSDSGNDRIVKYRLML